MKVAKTGLLQLHGGRCEVLGGGSTERVERGAVLSELRRGRGPELRQPFVRVLPVLLEKTYLYLWRKQTTRLNWGQEGGEEKNIHNDR